MKFSANQNIAHEQKAGYRWMIVFVLSVYKAAYAKRKSSFTKDSKLPFRNKLNIHISQSEGFSGDPKNLLAANLNILFNMLQCANVAYEKFGQKLIFDSPGTASEHAFKTTFIPSPSWHEALYFFDPEDDFLTLHTQPQAQSSSHTQEHVPQRTVLTTPQTKAPQTRLEHPGLKPPFVDQPIALGMPSPFTPEDQAFGRPLVSDLLLQQEVAKKTDTKKKKPPSKRAPIKMTSMLLRGTQHREDMASKIRNIQRQAHLNALRLKGVHRVGLFTHLDKPKPRFVVLKGTDTASSYLAIAYHSRRPDHLPELSTKDPLVPKTFNPSSMTTADFVIKHINSIAVGYSHPQGECLVHETTDLRNNMSTLLTDGEWDRQNGCFISKASEITDPIRMAHYHIGKQTLGVGHCNMCSVLSICMGARNIMLNLDSSSDKWFDLEKLSVFAFANSQASPVTSEIVNLYHHELKESTPPINDLLTLKSRMNSADERGYWFSGAQGALKDMIEKFTEV